MQQEIVIIVMKVTIELIYQIKTTRDYFEHRAYLNVIAQNTELHELQEVKNWKQMIPYGKTMGEIKWKMSNKVIIDKILQMKNIDYLSKNTIFFSNLPINNQNIWYRKIGKHIFAIYKVSKRVEIAKILRSAVYSQTNKFKRKTFKEAKNNNRVVRCAITNQIISLDNCHTDHWKTLFCEIVEEFMNIYNIDNTDIEKVHDEYILKEWRQFHKDKAILRLTTPKANRDRNNDM